MGRRNFLKNFLVLLGVVVAAPAAVKSGPDRPGFGDSPDRQLVGVDPASGPDFTVFYPASRPPCEMGTSHPYDPSHVNCPGCFQRCLNAQVNARLDMIQFEMGDRKYLRGEFYEL